MKQPHLAQHCIGEPPAGDINISSHLQELRDKYPSAVNQWPSKNGRRSPLREAILRLRQRQQVGGAT